MKRAFPVAIGVLLVLMACQGRGLTEEAGASKAPPAPPLSGQQAGDRPSEGQVSAKPSVPVSVNVAWAGVNVRSAVLWIANDLGIFREHGLEVNSVQVRNASAGIASIVSGEVQIGIISVSSGLLARAEGGDIIYFGALQDRPISTLAAVPSVKSGADMKGRKVGVQSFSGTTYFRTLSALQKLGVDPQRDNIELLVIADQPTMAQAMVAGTIDVAPLDYVHADRLPAGFNIWDLADLGVTEVGQPFLTTQAFATAHPEAMEGFLKAMAQSLAFIRDGLKDQAKRQQALNIAASYLKAEPDLLAPDMEKLARYARHDLRPDPSALKELQNQVAAENPKVQDVDLNAFINYSFLDRLQREGFFRRLGS